MIAFAQPSVANHSVSADTDVIAFIQNSAPEYLNGMGEEYGLCGDIYIRLKKRLKNRNVDLAISGHSLPIRRILEAIGISKAGIFCGASKDLEGDKLFSYSAKPIYSLLGILVTSTENKYDPISLEDLKVSNASVGTYFGTGSSKYLKEMGVSRVNGKFRSVEHGLKSVAANEIDYFFYHDLGLNYCLSKKPLSLRRVPTIFRSYFHWMIYSKKMPKQLQQIVDTELSAMIDEGVVTEIRKKYQLPTN